MFEALVASLGKVLILKTEDSGSVYAVDEKIQIPDFRLVMADGTNLLVEVKNFHPNASLKDFELEKDYFEGLIRYAKLTGAERRVAVYWSGWKLWTMVRPEVFTEAEDKVVLSFKDAQMSNDMAPLGDMMIGTRFPLKIRLLTDPHKDRVVRENGEVNFTISGLEIYCAEQKIVEAHERELPTI